MSENQENKIRNLSGKMTKRPTIKELELMWGEAWVHVQGGFTQDRFWDGYQCGLRDARPDILAVRTPKSCMDKYMESIK